MISDSAVYEPLFPSHAIIKLIRLVDDFNTETLENEAIDWEAHANPSFSRFGSIDIKSLPQRDLAPGVGLIT
jgi:hypothetical protein